MRGNPLLRTVILALALALAGLLVASVIRNANPPAEELPAAQAPPGTEQRIATYLTVVLSSPATSLVLAGPSGGRIEMPLAGALRSEHESGLRISNNSWDACLEIAWENTGQPNFAHLTLEPERLETRRVSLYFPPGTTTHQVALTWPDETSDE